MIPGHHGSSSLAPALHGRRRTLANQEEGVAISVPVQWIAGRLAPVVGLDRARHDRVLVGVVRNVWNRWHRGTGAG